MRDLSRRTFLRLGAASLIGALASACGISSTQHPSSAAPSHTPLATLSKSELLSGQNSPAIKPHWNVRFINAFQALDPELWRLSVEGLVAQPRQFSLAELQGLPNVTQTSRMVCVEGWSSKAEWVGFTYQTLAEQVQPTPDAQWVYFECADGYYEVLPIVELAEPRVLFVYRMDGEPLPGLFGGPLRLIVPPQYGYKGPKTIVRLEFRAEGGAGYWPTVGPYTTAGTIEPGRDRPLDLGGVRTIKGGEVTEY